MKNVERDYVRIAQDMATHGGSFERAMAKAIILADGTNLKKIITAFPELLDKWANWPPRQA